MNVKELSRAIISSLEYAHQCSTAPDETDQGTAYIHRLNADRDRMRTFLSFLAGSVKEGDPQLATALVAFLNAKPGEQLAGEAGAAPAGATTEAGHEPA